MKHIIILGDGMADLPVERLGGKTLLQYVKKPMMDQLAREGRCGRLVTVPEGFPPGSEVANTAILGYDLKKVYEGRGPLEAASIGYEMADDDFAIRCNIITIEDGKIITHNGGNLETKDGDVLTGNINVPGLIVSSLATLLLSALITFVTVKLLHSERYTVSIDTVDAKEVRRYREGGKSSVLESLSLGNSLLSHSLCLITGSQGPRLSRYPLIVSFYHGKNNLGAVNCNTFKIGEQLVEFRSLLDGADAGLQTLHMIDLRFAAH